jgi:signal transduction histidine kinase
MALDVREVLSDTLLLVERAAAKHQVTLDLVIARDLPPARGDRVQLQQVLVNLAMNAIHSVAGQPASEREVRLRVELDPEGLLRFSCEDTGPGIATHHLPKIFEPFFSTRTGGLGLGLAICRSIVEAHGGALHAENRAAGGALFQFKLPVHESGTGAATR